LVSIPYRKTKNVKAGACQIQCSRFPSLIGRLKTPDYNHHGCDLELFPSLIGRLKTDIVSFFDTRLVVVSIPYRKTKNLGHPIGLLDEISVSIPYRKTKNFRKGIKHRPKKVVSIPYRKTKNTSSARAANSCLTVSIPYRKTKNRITRNCACLITQFPSLIGRLKTGTLRYLLGPVSGFHPL